MNWDELRAIGELSAEERQSAEIIEFVAAFMRRLRQPIEAIHNRLIAHGYQFANEQNAYVAPSAALAIAVESIEAEFGLLPLSLKYFYLEIGSVDFRQSTEQLIHWCVPGRATASAVEILGEEDPLVVIDPRKLLDDLRLARTDRRRRHGVAHFGWREPHLDRWYCTFAPDEFHKANYSGGENYNLFIPDSSGDFRIRDLLRGVAKDEEEDREWFSDHVALCVSYGGFRGKYNADMDNPRKEPPRNEVAMAIAAEIDVS